MTKPVFTMAIERIQGAYTVECHIRARGHSEPKLSRDDVLRILDKVTQHLDEFNTKGTIPDAKVLS